MSQTLAAEFKEFVVQDIRIEGLQRISAGMVFSSLPVEIGDTIDSERVRNIIRTLFGTGFFKNVKVARDGNTLVIAVAERPTIASIEFTGNEDLASDKLTKALEQVGFAEGRIFNRSLLEKVQLELQRQYFSRAKYGVEINTTVTPLPRNRVAVKIHIEEGEEATIAGINIAGNQVFNEEALLEIFQLSTTNWLSFFTHDDQYSQQKLAADLESLRSYYLDRGYIHFQINSTQVSITPDKKRVFITINITEGERYRIGNIKLVGDLVLPHKKLFDALEVASGEMFSRQAVAESTTHITNLLGDKGYAFANVNAVPKINEEKKRVDLTFFIDPGGRAYVRRIIITGNTKTRDVVIRREILQMEGAWLSTELIRRSRLHMQRLGYFKDVNVEVVPVPGTADLVDVHFDVVERPSGSLSAGVGFSQSQGLIVNASLQQRNFLGSGKHVSLTFNNSSINTIYSFGYIDPYFTLDGISLGIDLFYRESEPFNANIARYSTQSYGGKINFGIPVSANDRLRLGLGYQSSDISLTANSPQAFQRFVRSEGNRFNIFSLNLGWSRDRRNSALLPTEGSYQRLFAEITVPIGGLQYYKVGYNFQWFQPLSDSIVLMLDSNVAYGNAYGSTEKFPFFENFYAGGINSIRGFRANTVGPKAEDGTALGGNLKLVGSIQLFFPIPFIEEAKSVRLSAFVDAGNVYGIHQDIDLGKIRYSAGVSIIWLSPFGAMQFSLAKALNTQPDDRTQIFQFSLGTSF